MDAVVYRTDLDDKLSKWLTGVPEKKRLSKALTCSEDIHDLSNALTCDKDRHDLSDALTGESEKKKLSKALTCGDNDSDGSGSDDDSDGSEDSTGDEDSSIALKKRQEEIRNKIMDLENSRGDKDSSIALKRRQREERVNKAAEERKDDQAKREAAAKQAEEDAVKKPADLRTAADMKKYTKEDVVDDFSAYRSSNVNTLGQWKFKGFNYNFNKKEFKDFLSKMGFQKEEIKTFVKNIIAKAKFEEDKAFEAWDAEEAVEQAEKAERKKDIMNKAIVSIDSNYQWTFKYEVFDKKYEDFENLLKTDYNFSEEESYEIIKNLIRKFREAAANKDAAEKAKEADEDDEAEEAEKSEEAKQAEEDRKAKQKEGMEIFMKEAARKDRIIRMNKRQARRAKRLAKKAEWKTMMEAKREEDELDLEEIDMSISNQKPNKKNPKLAWEETDDKVIDIRNDDSYGDEMIAKRKEAKRKEAEQKMLKKNSDKRKLKTLKEKLKGQKAEADPEEEIDKIIENVTKKSDKLKALKKERDRKEKIIKDKEAADEYENLSDEYNRQKIIDDLEDLNINDYSSDDFENDDNTTFRNSAEEAAADEKAARETDKLEAAEFKAEQAEQAAELKKQTNKQIRQGMANMFETMMKEREEKERAAREATPDEREAELKAKKAAAEQADQADEESKEVASGDDFKDEKSPPRTSQTPQIIPSSPSVFEDEGETKTDTISSVSEEVKRINKEDERLSTIEKIQQIDNTYTLKKNRKAEYKELGKKLLDELIKKGEIPEVVTLSKADESRRGKIIMSDSNISTDIFLQYGEKPFERLAVEKKSYLPNTPKKQIKKQITTSSTKKSESRGRKHERKSEQKKGRRGRKNFRSYGEYVSPVGESLKASSSSIEFRF